MRRIDPQQVAGVIGPAQSADDRRLLGQRQFLGVGVKIGGLNAELRQQLVHVIDLEVVILLIAGNDESAAVPDEIGQHIDVGGGNVRGGGIVAHGLVARIDDEQQLDVFERFPSEWFFVDANVKIGPQSLNDLLVGPIRFVAIFALGIVATAVEKDGFMARLGRRTARGQ